MWRYFYLCCWWCLSMPFLSTTGSRWCVDMTLFVYRSSFCWCRASTADHGPLPLLLPDVSLFANRGLLLPDLSTTPIMDSSTSQAPKALWDSYNCRWVIKWTLNDVWWWFFFAGLDFILLILNNQNILARLIHLYSILASCSLFVCLMLLLCTLVFTQHLPDIYSQSACFGALFAAVRVAS